MECRGYRRTTATSTETAVPMIRLSSDTANPTIRKTAAAAAPLAFEAAALACLDSNGGGLLPPLSCRRTGVPRDRPRRPCGRPDDHDGFGHFSTTLSLALRARGLSPISRAAAVTGFLVRTFNSGVS